jgi:hypothetical protein
MPASNLDARYAARHSGMTASQLKKKDLADRADLPGLLVELRFLYGFAGRAASVTVASIDLPLRSMVSVTF